MTRKTSPAVSLECATINASYPFNRTSADIILRTSDKVDFRVQSAILLEASPFFADLLSPPQPATATTPASVDSDTGSSPSIIPVPEDSTTLDLLLRILYPIPKPEVGEVDTLVRVYEAATGYGMAWPIVVMEERLVAATSHSPLKVWAAGCRTGSENVAHGAAKALLARMSQSAPADLEEKGAIPEIATLGDMAGISAANYFRLKQFLAGRLDDQKLLNPPPKAEQATDPGELACGFSTDIPSTDLICRPRSQTVGAPATLFYAHQSILSLFSPVLKARIALLRTAASHDEELQDVLPSLPVTLDFEEEPPLVSLLLKTCYDAQGGLSNDIQHLAQLTIMSKKYGITLLSQRVRNAWADAVAQGPLRAFFVAVNHNLTDLAKLAAAEVIKKPVECWPYVFVMETSSALAYHRLLEYYDSCLHVLRNTLYGVGHRYPQVSTVLNVPSYLERCHSLGPGEPLTMTSALRDLFDKSLSLNPRKGAKTGSSHPLKNDMRAVYEALDALPAEFDAAVKQVRIQLD
ncbi:hypothetical protein C8Q78DRAFT_1043500 [Trametes maxima]|nr:hypothetical protein C8Q78DRAFT_1043500 [Trametes maxima]